MSYLDLLNDDCILEINKFLTLRCDKINFYYAMCQNKDSLYKHLVDELNCCYLNRLCRGCGYTITTKCDICGTPTCVDCFFYEQKSNNLVKYCNKCTGNRGCCKCRKIYSFQNCFCLSCNNYVCYECDEINHTFKDRCTRYDCYNIMCFDCVLEPPNSMLLYCTVDGCNNFLCKFCFNNCNGKCDDCRKY
jgi:hypothetical protein